MTFADMALVPQVWRAKRLKPDFSRYPTIIKVNEELMRLEAFRKAHAVSHRDCPEEIRGHFS